jgi:hypothetical protein
MSFDDSTRFAAAPHAMWRELDGRAFVLDGETGEHFETNAVGGAIFRHAASGASFSTIRDELVREFEVDVARADSDLRAYLDDLVDRRLLHVR